MFSTVFWPPNAMLLPVIDPLAVLRNDEGNTHAPFLVSNGFTRNKLLLRYATKSLIEAVLVLADCEVVPLCTTLKFEVAVATRLVTVVTSLLVYVVDVVTTGVPLVLVVEPSLYVVTVTGVVVVVVICGTLVVVTVVTGVVYVLTLVTGVVPTTVVALVTVIELEPAVGVST